MIWERLLLNSEKLIKTLNFHCEEYNEEGMERFNDKELGWVNRTWHNKSVRRAHIDIVDVRDTKGLWMMHCCIFPEKHNDGPIFGWDVIAGKKKVTGAFYDWSPMLVKDHYMTQKFIKMNEPFQPSKRRELPDWALKILIQVI